METKVKQDSPALYVGTYAKYNNGSIAGKWLYLDDYADKDAFLEACRELHEDEHDPEFMYQDFEYMPKAFYNESGIDARIWEWLELDTEEREIVADYLDEVDESADISSAMDYYHGNIESMRHNYESDGEAYGWYLVHDCGMLELPEHLESYFDFEKYGDEHLQDMTVTKNGNIFRNW